MNDTIVILDYGSQYTQLIARKIRESNVHSIILPFDYSRNLIEKYNVKGIILSGGPSSVYENDAPSLPATIFDYNIFSRKSQAPLGKFCFPISTFKDKMFVSHEFIVKVFP